MSATLSLVARSGRSVGELGSGARRQSGHGRTGPRRLEHQPVHVVRAAPQQQAAHSSSISHAGHHIKRSVVVDRPRHNQRHQHISEQCISPKWYVVETAFRFGCVD